MKDIVSVDHLRVEFATDGGTVVGVEDVSFTIAPGETLCVVGESGSGKSVTSLSLMRLVEFGGGTITAGRMLGSTWRHMIIASVVPDDRAAST